MRKVLAAAALLLAGCNAAAHTGAASWSAGVRPAIAGEENTITVRDPKAQAPTLDITLRMSDMDMPAVHETLHRRADGSYAGNGVEFSMSGRWELIAPAHRISFEVR